MIKISSNEWVHYFKCLFNPDDEEYYDNNFLQYVKAALPSIEKQMEICGPLDNEFLIDEIIHATKQLKSNKSCGIDSISNEMFKNVLPVFLEIIRSSFIDILCNGRPYISQNVEYSYHHTDS